MGDGGPASRSPIRPARSSPITPSAAPGSVVAPTLEGSRPLLVEVQALVAPAGYGTPRRTASGARPEPARLLIAVLGRRAGIGLGSHDVYANLAGGLAVAEPASTCRSRSPSPRRCATGRSRRDRRDRRGRPARRAAAGRRPRAAAARGRASRLRARDRAAAVGAAADAPRASTACEIVRCRHASRRDRRLPSAEPPGRGEAVAGDARLTARRADRGRSTPADSPRAPLIRYIRLLGPRSAASSASPWRRPAGGLFAGDRQYARRAASPRGSSPGSSSASRSCRT